MISSFVLFIASMGELFSGGRPEWVLILYRANQVIAETFPYLMTATISYLLAMHWHLPRPPIALLSIIYLVVSSASVSAENNLPTFQIITALITPIYAIPLIAWLMRYPVLHLTRSNSAGSIVREVTQSCVACGTDGHGCGGHKFNFIWPDHSSDLCKLDAF